MKATISAAIVASLIRFCFAQAEPEATPFYLSFSFGEAPPERYNITEAGITTTVERTVDFTRDVKYITPGNWTWTVSTHNVTNATISLSWFRVHPNGTSTPQVVEDSNVAWTTYSFNWPNSSQNINEAVAAGLQPGQRHPGLGNVESASSCLYMLNATIPQNTSDAWDSSSSDCTSAFGEECVTALSNSLGRAQEECSSSDFRWTPDVRDACAGRLRVGAWNAREFGNSTMPNNETALVADDTFAWLLSVPFTVADTAAFESEANSLRVIAIASFESLDSWSTMTRQFLCNRPGEGLESAAVSIRGVWMMSAIPLFALFAMTLWSL